LFLVTVKVTHLGVVLPALIGMVLVALSMYQAQWNAWLHAHPFAQLFWHWGLVGFAVWFATLLAYFAMLQFHNPRDTGAVQPSAIVVLGSSTPNAQPSPALAERLKLGYQLALQYPQALVVVSGGVDFRQGVSVAQVMSKYLQTLGLPSSRILLEDKSDSTAENLEFSARVLQANGLSQKLPAVVVTNDFHTARAGWIAAKAGWTQVRMAGATTPLYMRYNAWTREYFACVSGLLLGEF
jgi:uncharacterized SAM-binding protein YcdF (DUF218 family)